MTIIWLGLLFFAMTAILLTLVYWYARQEQQAEAAEQRFRAERNAMMAEAERIFGVNGS